MKPGYDKKTIVYTTKAKCRDCYRCVRVCPVHAIKMEEGQAQVVKEMCISCGTCIRECPQNAKAYTTDYGKVLLMLEAGKKPIISIAPSYVSYYSQWLRSRLPSALRACGFSYVAETASAAQLTADATHTYIKENAKKNHLCSACPAVVSYVVNYAPEYEEFLVPIASPMVAHASAIKKMFPDQPFVFVGPCIAKKEEASYNENKELIDAVLTFEELDELMKLRGISSEKCEESDFDMTSNINASLFPLEGGLLKSAGIKTDYLNCEIMAVSGFSNFKQSLSMLKTSAEHQVILEPLFCKHGCINGPVFNKKENVYTKRMELLQTSALKKNNEDVVFAELPNMHVRFEKSTVKHVSFNESDIQKVLNSTGKYRKDDELNCTACGYLSCRDKAIAVLKGMAVPEMCMPFMRTLAEQKFDTLIQHDPNGIVTLNSNLEITHINDAFRKMFSCSDGVIGKHIAYLVDPEPFEKLSTGSETLIKQTTVFQGYNIVCHQMCYTLPEQNQYVGIFVDITNLQMNSEKLKEIKTETLIKANEIIAHQIEMAQELAKFLGEHTSKGEVLLNQLIQSTKK